MTDHLQRAIDLAVANVADSGGPFSAVGVAPPGQVFEGVNRVTGVPDPTAHAEVQAIRAAAAGLGTHDLTGCVLCCSCEPCPTCLGAALWARVSRVVFAADRHDAEAAGFDDAAFHAELSDGVSRIALATCPTGAAILRSRLGRATQPAFPIERPGRAVAARAPASARGRATVLRGCRRRRQRISPRQSSPRMTVGRSTSAMV